MNDRRRVEPLPRTPRECSSEKPCVYRENGVCDDPRINHWNSDAACFKVVKWKVNEFLHPLPIAKGQNP